jgi:hypothetical protein
VPFGYVRDGKTLAAHPQYAAIIGEIYAWYASGQWSYTRIAEALNARGERFAHWRDGEHLFGWETIRAILISPAYKGVVTCNDVAYPGQHPALVDPAIWEATAAIRKQREDSAGCSGSARGTGGLLTGIARCALCGGLMWYHIAGKPTSRTAYYRCATRAGRGASGCAAEMLRATDADAHALSVLHALSVPDTLRDQILARAGQLRQRRPSHPLIVPKLSANSNAYAAPTWKAMRR